MTERPRRPRSHILEMEARTALRGLMAPTGWVVREYDRPDYGIDDSVEIFRDGDATGLFFFVQSRGTDKPLEAALSMFLSRSQQQYFRDVGQPILLARYHSPTGKTYLKWFHRVDPYPQAESQTIHFDAGEELTTASLPKLAHEIELFRSWSRASIHWPVALHINFKDKRDARRLELDVFELVGDNRSLRVGAHGHENNILTVTISNDQVRVDASLASHTFHIAEVDRMETREMAPFIVLGAALVLSSLGHADRVGPLFEQALSSTLFSPDNTEMAATRLAEGGRTEYARRVGEHWLEVGNASQLGPPILLLTVVGLRSSRASIEERQPVAELLEHLGEAALVRDGGIADLGVAAFLSAARIYFATGGWNRADGAYQRAEALDPSIASRGDILAELAGAAHQACDYARAVELYSAALDLSPDNKRLLARRGDSLMHLGSLSDALAQFEQYLSSTPESSMETIWYLKYNSLRFLLNSGMEDGSPNPEAARKLLAERNTDDSFEEKVQRCLAAARLDPMNAEAWGELGRLESDAGRFRRAVGPLVLAALGNRSPRSFSIALVAALRAELGELATLLAGLALYDYGDEFHVTLRGEVAEAAADYDSIVAFVESIDMEAGRMRRGD